MKASKIIADTLREIPENELIPASKLYAERFAGEVSEGAYYQTLGRLCKANELCRIAKGTYYRPKAGKYGPVPPSQKSIVSSFTEPDKGTVVGYSLYNQLRLTTQLPKTVEVISSQLEQQTKSIGNVQLQFCDLTYSEEVKAILHMLEVLQNFGEIQDLNYREFLKYCEAFAALYRDDVFEQVYPARRYQKRTIAFLQSILNHYGVPNQLDKHLSALSEYKHPTMEELYEAAQLPQ